MFLRLDQHCPGGFWRQKPKSLRKWRSEISTEIRSIKLKIPPHRLGSRLPAVRATSRETAGSDLSSVAGLGGKTITGCAVTAGCCWSVTCDQGFCCLVPPLFICWCLIITFICLTINTRQSMAGETITGSQVAGRRLCWLLAVSLPRPRIDHNMM